MEKTEIPIKVKDFIEKYLIGHIGEIKDKYPYEAFLLISCGIEFLGKCLNNRNWQDTGQSKADFENAVENIPSLKRYTSVKKDLYKSLRCGLCHAFQPKKGFLISNSQSEQLDKNKGGIVINIKKFYDAFEKACYDLLEARVTAGKNLDDTFLYITEEEETSTTGSTRPMIEK